MLEELVMKGQFLSLFKPMETLAFKHLRREKNGKDYLVRN